MRVRVRVRVGAGRSLIVLDLLANVAQVHRFLHEEVVVRGDAHINGQKEDTRFARVPPNK